jgi:hypothetical protein
MVVSWFYERFVKPVPPEDRVLRSQWFLADTFVDVGSATAAMLYAAAAAIIVLTITIIDFGTDPILPYVLAGEGALVAALATLLGAPQVRIGGVLLLVAAHVCYYLFLILAIPHFEEQPNYFLFTALVALLTFIGAWFWELYLRRVRDGHAWEHHVVASLPYLAATAMLGTLINRTMHGTDAAVAQNAVAVVVLFAGALLSLSAVKASGLLALGAGTVCFYNVLYRGKMLISDNRFLVSFVLVLFSYCVAERIFKMFQRREKEVLPLEELARTALVVVGTALGLLGLRLTCDLQYLTLYWLVLGMGAVTLGAVFRESRYRWAAIVVFALAVGRAFQHDFWRLTPLYSFLSFAVLAAALLVVAWVYARYRQRTLRVAAEARGKFPNEAANNE